MRITATILLGFGIIPILNTGKAKARIDIPKSSKIKISEKNFNKKNSNANNFKVAEFALDVMSSLIKAKIGSRHVGVIDVARTALSHRDKMVINQNNNYRIENNKTTIKKSTIQFGVPASGKYNRIPFGYERMLTSLYNSELDAIQPSKKSKLLTTAGFNERRIEVLSRNTYLTLGQIKNFVKFKEEIYKLHKAQAAKHETLNENSSRNLFKRKTKNITMNALIPRIINRIKISSDMSGYYTNVVIHICQMRNLKCGITPEEVLQEIIDETAIPESRSLQASNILGKLEFKAGDNENIPEFKDGITTTIDAVIRKSDTFNENIQVLESLPRQIESGCRIDLEIIHHLEKGVNINLLSRLNNDNLPLGLFLMIESFGDPRGVLIDKQEGGIKYSGYAPVKLRYDYELQVEYITKSKKFDDENYKESPLVIPSKEVSADFLSDELKDEWYPERENTFHIGLKNISLEGDNPEENEKRYKLQFENDMSNSSYNTLNKLNTVLRKKSKDEFTEDDIKPNLELYKKIKEGLTDYSNDMVNNIERALSEEAEDDIQDLYLGDEEVNTYNVDNDDIIDLD